MSLIDLCTICSLLFSMASYFKMCICHSVIRKKIYIYANAHILNLFHNCDVSRFDWATECPDIFKHYSECISEGVFHEINV